VCRWEARLELATEGSDPKRWESLDVEGFIAELEHSK
jgi:hypothetical protein